MPESCSSSSSLEPTLAPAQATNLPDQPGFIYVLEDACDDRKKEMYKVVGSRKPPVTPLEIVFWWKAVSLDIELNALYNDLSSFRIAGNWYNKDAVTNYVEFLRGKA
jgi:hypothetical protein